MFWHSDLVGEKNSAKATTELEIEEITYSEASG